MRSGWAPSIPFKKTSSVTERCVCVRQNCWRRDIAQTATTVSRLCRQGKWLDFRKHSNGSERTNVQPPWVIEGGQRWAGTVCRASSGVRWMFTFWKEERISVKCLRIKYSMWRGTLSGSRENKALLLCSHYLFKVLDCMPHYWWFGLFETCAGCHWFHWRFIKCRLPDPFYRVQTSLLMYLLFTSCFKHLCLHVQLC